MWSDRDSRVRRPDLPDPATDLKAGVFTVRDLVFAHPAFKKKRLLERFTDVKSGQVLPGLEEFVTIYGDGRVNANTAQIQVLRAMFKEEEGQRTVAEAILHGRGGCGRCLDGRPHRQRACRRPRTRRDGSGGGGLDRFFSRSTTQRVLRGLGVDRLWTERHNFFAGRTHKR